MKYVGHNLPPEEHQKLHVTVNTAFEGKPTADVLCVTASVIITILDNIREQSTEADMGFAWTEFRQLVSDNLQASGQAFTPTLVHSGETV